MFEKLLRQDDTESVVERTLRVFLGSLSAMSVAFDVADGYAPHGRPQIERSPGDGRVTRADLEAAAGGDVPADADVGVARPVDPDLDADPGDPTAAAREWARQFAAGAAHLAEVREAQALIGRQEARRAQALAAFARSRPSSLDRPDAEVGAAAAESRAARPTALAAVSEWAVDEVAVALGITGGAATGLLAESLQLVSALPGTLAALSAGELTWTHVRVMTDLVAPLPDDVRAEAEARLLSRVAGKAAPQLRVAARRVVARLDAEAVRRRVADAVRDRRVSLYPGQDGMATLSAVLPLPVARAVQDALAQYADAAKAPGDERTKAQRMADCLVDLVLRPGSHGLAPVQARLTVVAAAQTLLGGDEPGEVDGDLVPAAMVRELAITLGLLPPDPPPAEAAVEAEPAPSAGDRGVGAEAWSPRRALADLLSVQRLTSTALAHRPHLALVDELTGALICLTDAARVRSAAIAGRGLRPPPSSPGYRPGEALDRFVRSRDRRCRFPGCRARPTSCDLDHTVPWPHGTTSADNLCCLCRHHHRLSHQAPGWSLRGLADGGLEWTTPTGQVLTTHPPRYGADDDLPYDLPPPAPPPGVPLGDVPLPVADDPPPF